MSVKEKIIRYIQSKKTVDEKVLLDISKNANDYNILKRTLVDNKFINEEELLMIFSRELKIPFLDLKKYRIPSENKHFFSQEVAFKYTVLPICKIGKALTLAISDPLDVIACDDIKIITGVEKVDLVLSHKEDILKSLNVLYGITEEIANVLEEDSFEEDIEEDTTEVSDSKDDLENLISESKHPPIVRAINMIIYNALKKRASDIHVEPYEDKLLVRYRVDGVLSDEFSFPKKNQRAVAARIKIISSLDITDARLPQDGRFKVRFENREIDFRVSTLPVHFGEKFVLRVLDKDSLSAGLENLGFSPQPLKLFSEAIKAPFGVILVTGPTGSGKSTTLYSIIKEINSPDKNIITIEDPVEYRLEGITQIQVNADIGLTFSAGLHSVLRQSPDIIMVGEIRDSETADIAIKASLTGEVILSTLHTNSAIGAITRLREMGTESFLLGSSLVALTAQRLARKLCPKCKEKYKMDNDLFKRLELGTCFNNKRENYFYRHKGCSFCGHSGYYGRIAILEVILLDDKIREMVAAKSPEEEIIKYAKQARGFNSLQEDGFLKCVEGITSIEEVIRVTSE